MSVIGIGRSHLGSNGIGLENNTTPYIPEPEPEPTGIAWDEDQTWDNDTYWS